MLFRRIRRPKSDIELQGGENEVEEDKVSTAENSKCQWEDVRPSPNWF
jgi:hypothetical protein